MFAFFGLSACTPGGSAETSNLECAAVISAASQLAGKRKLKTDAEFDKKALASGMTHLNTYAIPKGMSEKEAFEHLNARRAELIAEASPSDILQRAKTCIEKTPGQY
jgi:hypothetical protein